MNEQTAPGTRLVPLGSGTAMLQKEEKRGEPPISGATWRKIKGP